jgi:hypothetical protein
VHSQTMRASHLVTVAAECGLHRQCRIASPHRVILMRNGSAKESHNAIAHDLIHCAFIAVYSSHHTFQDRIEELAGLLRIAVSEQLQRALEVCKQDGDLFPLPFEHIAGGKNLVGQIRRRIGQRPSRIIWSGSGDECRGGGSISSPDQHLALLVSGELVHFNDFVSEEVQQIIVKLELDLERAI